MVEIATYRLNLLRAGYLLVVIGLGSIIWPAVLDPAQTWEPSRGVVVAMLAAFALLALIGLRHPLRMLPLLFWEIGWKTIWLLRIALQPWVEGTLDAKTAQTAVECLSVIVLCAVVPWDHVLQAYLRGPGERWQWRTKA